MTMKKRLTMKNMTKNLTFRFITIVSLIIVLWVGGLAVLIISKTEKTQSQQVEDFISVLKTIQSNEEVLLRDSLQKKGDSTIRLLKQTAGSLISNYDDEMLNRLARITTEEKNCLRCFL